MILDSVNFVEFFWLQEGQRRYIDPEEFYTNSLWVWALSQELDLKLDDRLGKLSLSKDGSGILLMGCLNLKIKAFWIDRICLIPKPDHFPLFEDILDWPTKTV